MIVTLIFSFLNLLSIIGYGIILELFYKNKKFNEFNLFFGGLTFLAFISLLVNFFSPINILISNIVFSFGILIALLYIGFFKKLSLIVLFVSISLFVAIISYKSYAYNDYGLYHLPYMEIIRNYKIIFGLSNFDFRFGIISIFQNISAIQYNSFMGKDSYVMLTPSILALSIYYYYINFNKTKFIIIFYICTLGLIYFLLHANRYGTLGNDIPSHCISLISYIVFFKIIFNKNSNNKENIKLLFYTIILGLMSKITLSLNFFLLAPILLLNRKLIFKNIFIILFSIIVLVSFFVKNFINTSCFVYPMNHTCIETTWKPNRFDISSSEFVSKFSSVMVKEFMKTNLINDESVNDKLLISNNLNKFNIENKNYNNFETKNINSFIIYSEYDKLSSWIKLYFNNHFKNKILKEIFPILFLNILIIFIFYFYFNYKNKSKIKLNKFELFFLLLIVISNIIWFLKAPLLRYGLSYVLILINLPFLFLLYNYLKNKEQLIKLQKIYKLIFLCFTIILISKNILRIQNYDLKNNFTDNIVPLEKTEYKKIKFNNFNFNTPIEGVCSITPPPCTVFGNHFILGKFKVEKNKYNYILISKKE